MIKLLEVFHNQEVRWIAGIMAQHMTSGEWERPSVADTLETAGIWKIKDYIQRRQATIAAQVAYRPIYELCIGE